MNSASQAVPVGRSQRNSIFWPRRILGPRPGLKEVNLVCWALFVVLLLVPLCVVHWIQVKRGEGSITQLHSDFVYVYGDGEIARDYPTIRIYDLGLQQRVFNTIYPAHGGVYGPSPYPPFVALLFKPFTYVSFESAFLLWMGISLALYFAGIGAATKAVFSDEPLKISLIFCFALAFFPFLFGTLLNGQLATVAVCAVGLAIYQEEQGNPFGSGLALALLSYKPTLLLLLLPMLLLTRRFRAMLGFITGAGLLILATTAVEGAQVWPAYARLLRDFGHAAGVGGTSRVELWKYLDINSFFAAILVGRSKAGLALLVCIIAVGAFGLAVLQWKSATRGRPAQWLAWAATLTWTLLLNVYVPIYDSVLVVIAIVLTLGALRDLGRSAATEWTTFLAVVIFAVSWKTEQFAKAHGIQLLSTMLLVLGTAQLLFLKRAIRQSSLEIAPS